MKKIIIILLIVAGIGVLYVMNARSTYRSMQNRGAIQYMFSISDQAQQFFLKQKTFVGLCNAKPISDYIITVENYADNKVQCKSDAEKYVIFVPLKGTKDIGCVDSEGYANNVSVSPTGLSCQ